MNKYDENYSAYFKAASEEYPEGAAVDSTTEDNLDGTPYLAAFFNDVIGFMYAAFHGVFGNPKIKGETVTREISNTPDNAKKSDVWDAIKTFVQRKADAVKQSLDDFIATKGVANGFAPLDASGKVAATYLPSYVDDVLEYANKNSFPSTGETGKIYVAKDTNKSYRWSGSTYTELSKYDDATQSASGLMSASDKKKLDGIADGANKYVHPTYTARTGKPTGDVTPEFGGTVTVSQVTSDDTGHVTGMTDRTITIPSAAMSGASAGAAGTKGLVPAPAAGDQGKFLRGDGSWGLPAGTIVETYLSRTSANALRNSAITSNIYCAINEAAASPFSVGVTGFAVTKGAPLKVMFTAACGTSNPKLKINNSDTEIEIKACRGGGKISLTASSGKVWDAYTTLELVYDGEDFVIMGNPVLLSSFGTDSGYIKYANGLIKQWGTATGGTVHSFPIAFTNSSSFSIVAIPDAYESSSSTQKRGSRASYLQDELSSTQFKLYVYSAENTVVNGRPIKWQAVGY